MRGVRYGVCLLVAWLTCSSVGCGSGAESISPDYEANFKVERSSPESSKLVIVSIGGKCVGVPGSRERIESVETQETHESVTLTVHANHGRAPSSGDCAGVGEAMRWTVHLESPLGDRKVLNGRYESTRSVPKA